MAESPQGRWVPVPSGDTVWVADELDTTCAHCSAPLESRRAATECPVCHRWTCARSADPDRLRTRLQTSFSHCTNEHSAACARAARERERLAREAEAAARFAASPEGRLDRVEQRLEEVERQLAMLHETVTSGRRR
jgi:hypothetical protein